LCWGVGKGYGREDSQVQEGPAPDPGPGFSKRTAYVRDKGRQYVDWKATWEHFVVEDTNVATHLARNTLGGGRRELFCDVMSAQPPLMRMQALRMTFTPLSLE
jgi:hypothetical protein